MRGIRTQWHASGLYRGVYILMVSLGVSCSIYIVGTAARVLLCMSLYVNAPCGKLGLWGLETYLMGVSVIVKLLCLGWPTCGW